MKKRHEYCTVETLIQIESVQKLEGVCVCDIHYMSYMTYIYIHVCVPMHCDKLYNIIALCIDPVKYPVLKNS